MSLIKISIYAAPSGKKPFFIWLNTLDEKTRSIIRTRISRIELGNFGDCKPIKGAKTIWELRIDYGPGYRIYYKTDGPKIIIILAGGIKKTQNRDITKVKEYLDYL